jgi:hypothetical protein
MSTPPNSGVSRTRKPRCACTPSSFAQQGQIPAKLSYALTSRQLAEIDNSYHFGSASAFDQAAVGMARPILDLPGPGVLNFAGPGSIRDYYGPLGPGDVWWLTASEIEGGITRLLGVTDDVFDQPVRTALDWGEPPLTLGAPVLSTDVYQAQPGSVSIHLGDFTLCAGCRQGDTFYPVFYQVNGANPGASTPDVYGFAPGSIHLYDQTGQEIPPTPFQGVATYQLPAQQARYKLVTPTTTWDFTSAEPSADQTPQGTYCAGVDFGVSTAPCQADPLVYLRYDAGLSLANTISPGVQRLQVTGYHQDPSAPPVTGLKLWTSTDGGKTWQQAVVTGGRDGTFTAVYTVPASGTNGYVSIKAQASDAAGNDITQEIDNAYGIAASSGAQGK